MVWMRCLLTLMCLASAGCLKASGSTESDLTDPVPVSVVLLQVNATLDLPDLGEFRPVFRNFPPLTESTWIGNSLQVTTPDPVIRYLVQDNDLLGIVRVNLTSRYHNVTQEHIVIGTQDDPPRLFPLDLEFNIAPFNDGKIIELWGGGWFFDGSAPVVASRGEAMGIQTLNDRMRTIYQLEYTVPLTKGYTTTFFQANATLDLTFSYARQSSFTLTDAPTEESRIEAEATIRDSGRLGAVTIDCRPVIVKGYAPCLSPFMWNPTAPT